MPRAPRQRVWSRSNQQTNDDCAQPVRTVQMTGEMLFLLSFDKRSDLQGAELPEAEESEWKKLSAAVAQMLWTA